MDYETELPLLGVSSLERVSSHGSTAQRPEHEALTPNLFVIGAMKAGSTLLWKLLSASPDIFMSTPKEPSYFVQSEDLRRLQPFFWEQGYWRSWDRYQSLFASAGRRRYYGDASVYYAHAPMASGVAERIYRFNPQARLIYILRDPVQRSISHYWHCVVYNGEHRAPLRAIRTTPQYLDVSHYAMQLKEYWKFFPPSQIMVLTLEDLIENPQRVMSDLFAWLGATPGPLDERVAPENAMPGVILQRGRAIARIKEGFDRSPLLKSALETIPHSVKARLTRVFRRRIDPAATDMEPVVAELLDAQRSQTRELADLLGRPFPKWSTWD